MNEGAIGRIIETGNYKMATKLKLGEILIQEGRIDDEQLKAGLAHQRRWGKKLGESLVQLGFLTELEVAESLSRALRLPLIDITQIEAAKITKELLNCVSVQTAREKRIVPIAVKEIKNKRRLVVASSDPTNYKAFDELQFKLGLPVLPMIAPDTDIEWFIRKYYLGETETLPLNYISGVDILNQDGVDDDATEGSRIPDPISSIFWDSDFTGITNWKDGPQSSSRTSSSSRKKKT